MQVGTLEFQEHVVLPVDLVGLAVFQFQIGIPIFKLFELFMFLLE